jgi:hypothetical protein
VLPLVPVTVSRFDPPGVAPLVVTVSVEEVVAGLGLNVARVPTGRSTLRLTGSVKPLIG